MVGSYVISIRVKIYKIYVKNCYFVNRIFFVSYVTECGQVGRAETFGESRVWWHRIGGFIGVANKIGGSNKKTRISVEYFVDFLANSSPPWEAYWGFMHGCLIAWDKIPGVCPVGIRETWCRIFSKCILKVT